MTLKNFKETTVRLAVGLLVLVATVLGLATYDYMLVPDQKQSSSERFYYCHNNPWPVTDPSDCPLSQWYRFNRHDACSPGFDLNRNGIMSEEEDQTFCQSPGTPQIICRNNGENLEIALRYNLGREDRLLREPGSERSAPNPVDGFIASVEVGSDAKDGTSSTTCADPKAHCGQTPFLGVYPYTTHVLTFSRPTWFAPRIRTLENGVEHVYPIDVTYASILNENGATCALYEDEEEGFVIGLCPEGSFLVEEKVDGKISKSCQCPAGANLVLTNNNTLTCPTPN